MGMSVPPPVRQPGVMHPAPSLPSSSTSRPATAFEPGMVSTVRQVETNQALKLQIKGL